MTSNSLLKPTLIRTVFVSLEVIALTALSIYAFLTADTGIWGYWGNILAIFSMLSPIFVYVMHSAVFNTANLIFVLKNRQTPELIRKYRSRSKKYLIWGLITGGLYSGLLAPVFLLENIFLFKEYNRKSEEIERIYILP